MADLERLDAWDPESGALNVIIETPKSSRNKYAYEPETGAFLLKKVLPSGMVFPYDFGFVPSTLGGDGDPLDVLVLMDEPAFPGCRIPCRLIGVIEGEQTEDGSTERNDRLVAVAEGAHDHSDLRSLKDLNENLIKELEHFFSTYHDLDGTTFHLLGVRGPGRAQKLVQEAVERRQSEQGGKGAGNGRAATAKA